MFAAPSKAVTALARYVRKAPGGTSTPPSLATSPPVMEVKRIVELHGDVYFASMEQLEKLFTNKQIREDPPLVEIHCEHSHITDFSAMEVIQKIGSKYKALGKELVITRLIPVCSRVVGEATIGNQPMMEDVTVRTVAGESQSQREAAEEQDLAIVQKAKRQAENDLDEDREF